MPADFDCYANWAFKENPFQPSPLHPDSRGERLLVGRDRELDTVKKRLHKQGKITCVEGPVGVGKTSLVNIAAFQCLNGYISQKASQLLIPCTQTFQLTPGETLDDFCIHVFTAVAQTLIVKANEIRGIGLDLSNRSTLDAWLNSPNVTHVQAGLKFYFEVSRNTQLNTSSGFSTSGFIRLVKEWLKEIFPAHGSGGVVCIIDNLELLETGNKARKILEGLRDRLFDTVGLRWVFCGANGIVSSVVASPRLGGYLVRPVLEIGSVGGEKIPEILKKRSEEFATRYGDEYLPILTSDLQQLYWIINFNLRDLLAHADDYCTYIFEHAKRPTTDTTKHKEFESWLKKQTVDQYQDLAKRMPKDAWELLDTAMSEELKGSFGPGDFNIFKKNSYSAIEYSTFKRHMGKFEDFGLVARSVNDSENDEKKRTLYHVTSKGALVHYARHINNETHTLASPWLRRVSTLRG